MGQNFTVFGIQYECLNKSTSLNCNLEWDLTGNVPNLTELGPNAFGEFEADGDLAGAGLLWSFGAHVHFLIHLHVTRGGVVRRSNREPQYEKVCTISSKQSKNRQRKVSNGITAPTREKRTRSEFGYDLLETLLIAMADYQIIFGAALCLYFNIIGKCAVSMYHFNMGLNLLILVCGNTLLNMVITRSFWATPASYLAPLIVVGVLLFFQGKILWIQHARNKSYGMAESWPNQDRNSSLVFLQAACFLDPNALGNITQQLYDTDEVMREAKISVIGDLLHDEKKSVELVIWFFLVYCFAVIVVYQFMALIRACCRRTLKNGDYAPMAKKNRGCWHTIRLVLCSLTLALSCVVCIWRIMYLFSLKEWVAGSGWLKKGAYMGNADNGISTFGQAASVSAAIGFGFVAAERVE